MDKGVEALAAGRFDAAIEECSSACQCLEQIALSLCVLADRRATRLRPQDAQAFFNLGVAFQQSNALSEAIKAWETSLALSLKSSGEQADVHTNLSAAYILHPNPAQRDPAKALKHIRRACELDPEDGQAHFNRAAILESQQILDEAEIAYKKALDLGVQRAEQNLRNVSAFR